MSIVNPGHQQLAIGAINDYASLASQINSILTTIAVLKQREATHAYSTMYANMPTYVLNTDGSPGANDATPVLSHPMQGLTVSSNDISGFVGYIVNDLYNFLTGVSGPTVADRRPAITGMLP